MSSLISVLVFAVATPLAFSLWRKYISRRGLPLPPGPNGYPVIGNIFNAPRNYPWLKYTEWRKKYGDIIHMNMLGTHTIVLNSLEVATELLEKRSANYADRPEMVMVNELMGWDWDFAHMPQSERWRRHRRVFHQYFQPRAVPAYQQVQRRASGNLLRQFLETPDQFASHIRSHSGSIILWLVYGYEIKPENDFYVRLADEAMQKIGPAVHAGSFFVDYIPFLKYIPEWVPGAGFQRIAKESAIASSNLKNRPFEIVKKAMEDGTAVPSFVTQNLERIKDSNEVQGPEDFEEVIKNSAALAYIAGADTTVSVILTWIMAMVHYPDVFARVQAELDTVVGKSQLPDFHDRESLPYLDAVISETLRWQPVTPQALPHRAAAEDVYNGYYIPAGSTVVPNVWGILHDETLYGPETNKFKPERFLKQNGKELPPDPVTAGAFGFGRRICPGRHLAINSIWITIASILACFNISKPIGSDGKPYDPPIEYNDSLVVHPNPFQISLVPRSTEAVHLIKSTKE